MSNHNGFGTALWLVAGGAAGYAATRWLVAPHLGGLVAPAKAIASASKVATAALPAPRALAVGPSGDMRPIDPYSEPTSAPSSIATTPTPTTVPPSTTPARTPAIDGPITMPSQLDVAIPSTGPAPVETRPGVATSAPTTSTSAQFATPPSVRRFDGLFQRYRGAIPIEYVRALVTLESSGQPNVRGGSAIGLMQIVPVVLDDYNKRHGTKYRGEHLTDPATNVAIGCELLRIIIESYRRNHPRVRTLQADWNNQQFVELLTFGWNAGFSEAGGLGRVARYLEGLGPIDITIDHVDITIDQVAANARSAGASKHLSNPAKVAWCKSVARLYQRERAASRAVGAELATVLTT